MSSSSSAEPPGGSVGAPRENLALGRPYTLDPAPNGASASTDIERTRLTDGVHGSRRPLWLAPEAVEWVRAGPVEIVIDLGAVMPIGGVAISTAAGLSGVWWPSSVRVLVSDDGASWVVVTDLAFTRPGASPYAAARLTQDGLATRGRYVALVVEQDPYTIVDEVLVFREDGPTRPPQGVRHVGRPRALLNDAGAGGSARRVGDRVWWRLRRDLHEVLAAAGAATLSPRQRSRLLRRGEALAARIDAQTGTPSAPPSSLPLSGLHRDVFALHAAVLRARGLRGVVAWHGHRYAPLTPLDAPPSSASSSSPLPPLRWSIARGERRADVVNLTNAADVGTRLTAQTTAPWLTVRQVMFTDTAERTTIGAALSAPASLRTVKVSAGTTTQLWLELDGRGLTTGEHRAAVEVKSGGRRVAVQEVVLEVKDVALPEIDVAVGGWDETNDGGGLDVTEGNRAALIAALRDAGVNMPWSNAAVVPTPGRYDADGAMMAPPDFSSWDTWVARWPGARRYGVFANVGDSFGDGEPIGTARGARMIAAWLTSWMARAAAQGISPRDIVIQLVDEPRTAQQDALTIAWADALHETAPTLTVLANPTHARFEEASDGFYAAVDIVAPNMTRFLGADDAYRRAFVDVRDAGRELWLYACSGPAKLLDPQTYWRGQFVLAASLDARGALFWSFSDDGRAVAEGATPHPYLATRPSFSPLFIDGASVTVTKHLMAVREGAQDHALLTRARAAAVGRPAALARVEEALARAVATLGPEEEAWLAPRDRALFDRAREEALAVLAGD